MEAVFPVILLVRETGLLEEVETGSESWPGPSQGCGLGGPKKREGPRAIAGLPSLQEHSQCVVCRICLHQMKAFSFEIHQSHPGPNDNNGCSLLKPSDGARQQSCWSSHNPVGEDYYETHFTGRLRGGEVSEASKS